MPAPQRRRIASAELSERNDSALKIGPPFEGAAVFGQQHDVEFGLDVDGAVPLEFEMGVPRHRRDRALEKGMRVVEKSRIARVFDGGQSAARQRRAIDRKHLKAGLAEISLEDKPVMAGAENDEIVTVRHPQRRPS